MTREDAATSSKLGCTEQTCGVDGRGGTEFTPGHQLENGEKACGQTVTSKIDIPSALFITVNLVLSTVALRYSWSKWMADLCNILYLTLKVRIEPSWEQEQTTP